MEVEWLININYWLITIIIIIIIIIINYSPPLQITVYIYDINDNSPQFSKTSIDRTLPEGVPVGTIVDIVSATDNDYKTNAVIKYSETSGDEDG